MKDTRPGSFKSNADEGCWLKQSGADTLRKQVTHEKTLLNAMGTMKVLWIATKGGGNHLSWSLHEKTALQKGKKKVTPGRAASEQLQTDCQCQCWIWRLQPLSDLPSVSWNALSSLIQINETRLAKSLIRGLCVCVCVYARECIRGSDFGVIISVIVLNLRLYWCHFFLRIHTLQNYEILKLLSQALEKCRKKGTLFIFYIYCSWEKFSLLLLSFSFICLCSNC